MTPLEVHAAGVVIRVKARAGGRRNAISGLHDGALRVEVTTAPEKGKANQAIIAILADAFQLAKSSIELVSGPTNPQKRFLLTGLDLASAQQRLDAALLTDG